ncbi:protein SEEDLING LETHAL 1, chloroplastic-like [Rutidosis leptorrhynchoides]|uniref:protein SEEDLING LETHAL 1, chloroplastic-like n=1 Tax=Rutidosis leptorrhynchoides TaxID=125765 RepID=UPI003A98DB6D
MEVWSSSSTTRPLSHYLFDLTSSSSYHPLTSKSYLPVTLIPCCSSSSFSTTTTTTTTTTSAAVTKLSGRIRRPSTVSAITSTSDTDTIRPIHLKKVEELSTKEFAYNPPPKHLLQPTSKTTLISPKPSPPPPISATNTAFELQEKLVYLDSFGIDLIPLLNTHPPLISTSLSHIKSTVSFLSTTIPLPGPALNRLVSICPEILTLPLPSIISAITFLLREAHVRSHHLRHVIHRRPRLLTSDIKTRLRPTLYFLQGTIGIAEINKHAHLLSSSVEDKLIPRIEYFHENIGISYDDTMLIFRRFPSLFCYSIKENLEPKFNYFVSEMGRDLKELVEFPQYFSFSLENRIKPRHLRCMEKGVCLPLPAMLRSSEKRFLERMEVCCDSSMPAKNSPFWYYKHTDD